MSSVLLPIDTLPAHDNPVNHVCFSISGRVMATSDTALKVRIWRDREFDREFDLAQIGEHTQRSDRIRDIQLTADGQRLFAVAGEYLVSYDLASPAESPDWIYVAPRMLVFFVVPPTSIALSDNDGLAAVFDNGTLASWNRDGSQRSFIRHNAVPRYIRFLNDDTIVGTESFGVSQWHLGDRKPIWHRQTDERIYGMAVTSDGKYIALRRLFTTIVQRLEDGAPVHSHKQGRGLPLVAFGHGSHILAIGSQHAIDVVDVDGGKHASLPLTDAELISLAFLPDFSQIVGGCSDGRVRTWDNPMYQQLASGPG